MKKIQMKKLNPKYITFNNYYYFEMGYTNIIECEYKGAFCGQIKFELCDNIFKKTDYDDIFDDYHSNLYRIFNINENSFDSKIIYLNSLFVDKNFRNKGLGNIMMQYFINSIKEANKQFSGLTNLIILNANPFEDAILTNKALPLDLLIKFYQKQGFIKLKNYKQLSDCMYYNLYAKN